MICGDYHVKYCVWNNLHKTGCIYVVLLNIKCLPWQVVTIMSIEVLGTALIRQIVFGLVRILSHFGKCTICCILFSIQPMGITSVLCDTYITILIANSRIWKISPIGTHKLVPNCIKVRGMKVCAPSFSH